MERRGGIGWIFSNLEETRWTNGIVSRRNGLGSLVVAVSRVEKNRVELLETPGSWHKVVRYLRRVNAAPARWRASSLLILSSRFSLVDPIDRARTIL